MVFITRSTHVCGTMLLQVRMALDFRNKGRPQVNRDLSRLDGASTRYRYGRGGGGGGGGGLPAMPSLGHTHGAGVEAMMPCMHGPAGVEAMMPCMRGPAGVTRVKGQRQAVAWVATTAYHHDKK